MSSTTVSCPIAVHDAHDIAQVVLSGLPTRWRHTVGVARRAEELTDLLDPYERDTLVAAAWLHDIGYAEELVDTGFHPLDGAQFLDRYRWPQRICGLVAHHSGAAYAAADRGLAAALAVHPTNARWWRTCSRTLRAPYLLAIADRVESRQHDVR